MMKFGIQQRIVSTLAYAIYNAPLAAALPWEECRNDIIWRIGNGTLVRTPEYFFNHLDPDSLTLTLDGCRAICGGGQTRYGDIGPILNTWLIPPLLLLSQMNISPQDKRSYLAIVHLLGDPIDSTYCLLHKLESWSRCSRIAKKIYRDPPLQEKSIEPVPDYGTFYEEEKKFVRTLGTILGAIEELVGDGSNPHEMYREIVEKVKEEYNPEKDCDNDKTKWVKSKMDEFCRTAAYELAESRTDDIFRTALAVGLYFYQVACAFNANLGGTYTSPPGGRIGIALFLTFILPPVLLSNLIGSFPSSRMCYYIINKNRPCQEELIHFLNPKHISYGGELRNYYDYRNSYGGNYTYRYSTDLFASGEKRLFYRDWPRVVLYIVAACPVIISSSIGLTILYNLPPRGPNCRWILLVIIAVLYFLSFLTTTITRRVVGPKKHWRWTIAKDAVFAMPSLVLLFASCSGLFNSCWCWSGVYRLGKALARVNLNAEQAFGPDLKRYFPDLFKGCLGFQSFLFVLMVAIGWQGLCLMRWSEHTKRDDGSEGFLEGVWGICRGRLLRLGR